MNRLLLIYNKGSFSYSLINKLKQKFNLFKYVVKDDVNLLTQLEDIEKIFSCDLKYILFISGETRNSDKMDLLNYKFPKEILNLSIKYNVDFIYLSSLAVFVNNYELKVNIKSVRVPVDEYGYSKNKLDLYVKSLSPADINIKCIYPASFYSGNGRSSIEKIELFFKKYPYVFKYFIFPGSMSYIERDELEDTMIDFLDKNTQELILSKELLLEDLWRKVYPNQKLYVKIPRIPMFILKVLNSFLPNTFIAKLKMILVGVKYGD